MKITTCIINGINSRLENLLHWPEEGRPDVVCLPELKCEDQKFPERALLDAGLPCHLAGRKSWNGVAILSCYGKIQETWRGLDGDPADTHSRNIEAFINGIVTGCLYLPNGNPFPGPKFIYQ